jgi:hypothetical protein
MLAFLADNNVSREPCNSACHQLAGSGGIGGEAWAATTALSEGPGALGGHCGSSGGGSFAGSEFENVSEFLVSQLDWSGLAPSGLATGSVIGEGRSDCGARNSSQFSSSHLASSRQDQEPFKLERDGPKTSGPADLALVP